MPVRTPPLTAIGLIMLLAAAGCRPPAATVDDPIPADFALLFLVDTTDHPDDPRRRRALHVVEPDRTLRAALGPGVTDDLHPPATATITPRDMRELYRLAETARLASAPGTPGNAAPPPPGVPVYRMVLRVDGDRHERVLVAGQQPAADQLLTALVRLRGGR
ncbi:MAG: hypothetical protein AAFX76_01030 [Planctomycetota bacterium]